MDDERKKPGIAYYACVAVAGLFALMVLLAALGLLFGHIALPWKMPK